MKVNKTKIFFLILVLLVLGSFSLPKTIQAQVVSTTVGGPNLNPNLKEIRSLVPGTTNQYHNTGVYVNDQYGYGQAQNTYNGNGDNLNENVITVYKKDGSVAQVWYDKGDGSTPTDVSNDPTLANAIGKNQNDPSTIEALKKLIEKNLAE